MQERKPVSPSGRFAALVRPRRQQQQQQQQQQQIMSDPPQLAALLQTIASKMTHLEGLPQQLTETRADLTANLQQLSARTIELSAHTAQTQQQVKLVQQTQEQHTTQMQQLQHQQTSLELTQQALAWDRETTLDANNELQSRGVVAVWPKKSQQQYAREQVAAELGVAVDQVEPHKKGGGFSAKLGEQAVKQKIATQRAAGATTGLIIRRQKTALGGRRHRCLIPIQRAVVRELARGGWESTCVYLAANSCDLLIAFGTYEDVRAGNAHAVRYPAEQHCGWRQAANGGRGAFNLDPNSLKGMDENTIHRYLTHFLGPPPSAPAVDPPPMLQQQQQQQQPPPAAAAAGPVESMIARTTGETRAHEGGGSPVNHKQQRRNNDYAAAASATRHVSPNKSTPPSSSSCPPPLLTPLPLPPLLHPPLPYAMPFPLLAHSPPLHLQGLYHTTFTPLGPPQAVQSHTRGLPVQAALRGLAAQAAATEALTKAGSRAMWTGEGHTSSKCGVVIMEVLEVYNRG